MFAIDGCKLPSNASKEWSGTIEDLTEKRDKLQKYFTRLLFQHQELDKDENARKKLGKFRKTMGDDRQRRERSIRRIEKKLKQLNEFLTEAKPRRRKSLQLKILYIMMKRIFSHAQPERNWNTGALLY